MKKLTQQFKTFIVLSMVILALIACSPTKKAEINTVPTINTTAGTMLVHYIDVGQADCILVQLNNKNLLIDAGNREDAETIISYLKKKGVKKLEYVITTHPHEDHIGGMAAIINAFPIDKFYAPKASATTKTFEAMITALKNKNLKINVAKAGETLDLGSNSTASLLSPNSATYTDLNDYSTALKITYGSTKFLFMGDAEKVVEKEILDKGFDVSCDVLKLGHHGSNSSSSNEFLDKATPKTAIISCGKDNTYGHPNKETLDALKKRNIQIYRTDKDGTILLSSDGKEIKNK